MIDSITAFPSVKGFPFLNKDISLRSTVRDAFMRKNPVEPSWSRYIVRSSIGASRHSRLKAEPSPEHPKWQRNLQFLPLSETKGILTIPYTADMGALPRGWGGGKVHSFLMRLLHSLSPYVILGPFTIWVVRADRWLVWNVSRLLPLTNLRGAD